MIKYIADKKQCNIPFFIHIELTEKCPLRCPQCYCSLEKGQDIDWEFCQEIIKEAAEWGIPKILLTGGEPLVYRHLLDVVSLINKSGMESIFSTSGAGLNHNYCKRLRESGISKVFVSLNGSSKEIHNLSRDRYEDAIEGIKLLKAEGIWCGINWVARGDNAEDFGNMVKLAKEIKVDKIDILSNKPDRNGIVVSPMSNSLLSYLCDQIRPHYEKGFVTVELCYPELRKMLSERKIPVINRECAAGRLFMEVNVDKTFSLCRHIQFTNKECLSMREFWELNYRQQLFQENAGFKNMCHNANEERIRNEV